jgi:hypothetical protein
MKKQYMKPTMQVVVLQQHQILCSSPYPTDVPLGYIPGIDEEKNIQA